MKPYPRSSKTADLSESGHPQHVRTSGRRTASRLLLMALFLALVPTAPASNTWYADGVNGNDNNNCKSPQTACKTIGHAISLAASGDSIKVAAATYTENLTIGFSLTITGSGASTTVIDGGGVHRVVGVFRARAHVTLSELTIRNGFAGNGGGIYNSGTLTVNASTISGNKAGLGGYGGGIYNGGTLAINNCTLSGNSAGFKGGGIYNVVYKVGTLTVNNSAISNNSVSNGCLKYCLGAFGGGIVNYDGTLTVNDSTISNNSVSEGCRKYCFFGPLGGGIYSGGGTTTINKSTISGNGAGVGGGIDSTGHATVTINDSTISGNSGGGIYNGFSSYDSAMLVISNSTLSGNSANYGGGIVNSSNNSTVTLQNSIVANNSGGNCYGTMTSNGYNLSSDNTCNFNGTGDLNSTHPKFGKLGNYGGPTQTIPLLTGSPAIDAGNPKGCTDGQGNLLKTDQRGRPRPDKEDTGGCDMGAFERQKD